MTPSAITLCFLIFAILMFALEKLPLAVTAMIVTVGLAVTGVLPAKEAFLGFVDTNVILFVAMFVIGGALFETGMANKIGGVVSRFAKSERQLMVVLMLITGLMSGILSNTGTSAILIPVILGIAMKSDFARSRLLMPMAFASTLGGNLSLIGSPNNLVVQGVLSQTGLKFGFFEYAKIGLPLLIVGILYFVFIGYRFLPQTLNTHVKKQDYQAFHHHHNIIPKWKQWLSLCVLIATLFAMVFEEVIGIKLYISACIGALILVIMRVITEKQAYQAIDSQVVFLFAGTLALTDALKRTGAGADIAHSILSLLGDHPSTTALLLTILLLSCLLTNFMSNTATAALLAPIGLSIANSLNADPRAVLMAVVIGSSCAFATPIATPANTMILSVGQYKFTDYTKAGIPLIIISVLLSMLLLPIFFPLFL
ncbi:SLC13 family permease [[Haemophilus] ducreyi]|uniref:SLC13 family permease n=1 Tax=Haemophilus ducreyi TaxID=730 RepID=UPI000654EBB9|nr:SLC13 family permease [[Haemophilus] ducreyi]AKO45283.1 cation transporter [[Haemophilus] ducreyi]AKO46685.1 cation transporter [[Haemophilus] ducreyi]AKO48026.1 cation transporter [[Haemophilus] ducreyi]AKO49413.1 cation transporter [[Haemophilus] ducreyi]ANF61548.1 cation transporter [[Haemophilus] ducreyi]